MSVRVTFVDGLDLVGVYAPDGSWNVFDATDVLDPVGVYAPCGAYNVTLVDGSTPVGVYAPNGSLNVLEDPTALSDYHSCGAFNIEQVS